MSNNRARGARGERDARDAFRQHIGGSPIRAAQANGKESADLLHTGGIFVEVKLRKSLSVQNFMDQAVRDCGGKTPIVLMREDRGGWLVMHRIEDARQYAREVMELGKEGQP